MGRIVGAFGIQGWVKLKTFTEAADGLADHDPWWVRSPEGWVEMKLEEFAARPAATVARLAGVVDRTGAERLRGSDVAVPREALGDPEEGSVYWFELVGMQVETVAGVGLGLVKEIFQTGENCVLVVANGRERMIPFVPLYVKVMDRKARRIVVEWEADFDA